MVAPVYAMAIGVKGVDKAMHNPIGAKPYLPSIIQSKSLACLSKTGRIRIDPDRRTYGSVIEYGMVFAVPRTPTRG